MYLIVLLLQLFLLASRIKGEHCLEPADSLGREIPFSSDASPSLPKNSQVIITSYQFTCEGMIFAWHTYVQDKNTSDKLEHKIHFQVWRPSSAVESDGCYSLVGENVFDDVRAEEDGLISVTVPSDKVFTVSPGDVVGYFAHSDFNEEDISATNNTEIKLDWSYTNETVWYHVNTAEDPLIINGGSSCFVQIGDGGTLMSSIHAAPVLSIEMAPVTISPTPTTSGTSFVIPTTTPGGIQPGPRGLSNTYIIIFIVLGCLIFLVLLSICLVILIAMAFKKKREKRRLKSHIYSEVGHSTDPLYEAIGPAPERDTVEVVDVKVTPNESYGLVESAASGVMYDSVNVTIKQSFKNLAITLP